MHRLFVFSRPLLQGLLIGLVLTVFGFSLLALGHFAYTASVWGLWKHDRLSMASLYFYRGNYYFGGGGYDLDMAMASYVRARDFTNVNKEPISYQIGRIHFIKGDLDRALEEFDRQLTEDPEFVKTYYMRGLTHGYRNEFDLAEKDFLTYLERKPESWAGHNDLVWIYFRSGNYAKAEEYARKGLAIAPSNPWLNNALGAILVNQEKYAEAEAPLREAVRLFGMMTPNEWGEAYPGNDPRVYSEGQAASRMSAEENLKKVMEKLGSE